MMPQITTFYAGVLALWLLLLAERIPRLRRQHKIGIGSGGNSELGLAVRCHGNASEYIPIGLILLLVTELSGAPAWLLHACGMLFTVGRVIHGWGLARSPGLSFGRFWGTLLTWAVMAVLGVTAVILSMWGSLH